MYICMSDRAWLQPECSSVRHRRCSLHFESPTIESRVPKFVIFEKCKPYTVSYVPVCMHVCTYVCMYVPLSELCTVNALSDCVLSLFKHALIVCLCLVMHILNLFILNMN